MQSILVLSSLFTISIAIHNSYASSNSHTSGLPSVSFVPFIIDVIVLRTRDSTPLAFENPYVNSYGQCPKFQAITCVEWRIMNPGELKTS